MARQRRVRRVSRDRRGRGERVEVQLGDEHAILARQRRARRRPPARAGRRRRRRAGRARDGRGLAGDQKRLRAPARSAAATPERVAQTLDDALDVEEVDVARAARPVLGAGVARPRERRRRASRPPRANRAPISNSRDVAPAVAPVVRDGVDQAGQQRRPQRVELRRQRIGDRDAARAGRGANAAAAFASMKPNVTLRTARRRSARAARAGRARMRGSGGGGGARHDREGRRRACRSRSAGRPPR